MIQAQSADGVMHQFPDGTDPGVIDRVMKDYATSKAPLAQAQPATVVQQSAPEPEPPQDTGAVFGRPGLNVGTSEGKESLADRISGDKKREFDFPSVAGISGPQAPETPGALAKTVVGAAFANDEGFSNILQQTYPDAKFSQDRFGNVIMSQGGKHYYVNRPGLDSGDILRLAPNVAGGIGVGNLVGRAFTGVLPRMVAVSGAEAGLSAGTDLAAQAAGSGQPIDINKMLLAGGLGFAGEGIAAGIGTVARSLGSRAAQIVQGPNGASIQLAPELLDAIRKAGIDPTQLTNEWLQRFQTQAQKSLNPEEAARFTDLQTLPTPVPATRGDISRTAPDQMFEDQALKGSFGQRPAAVMQSMRGRQEDALRSNVEQVQAGMSGTGVPAVVEPGQGGALASDTLVGMRDRAKADVDAAYDAARNDGGQAGISRDVVPGMAHNVQATAADFVGHTPKAEGLAAELQALGAQGGDADVTVRSLFDWRRKASALRGTTTDPAEATAIGRMVRQFDEEMKAAVDQQIIRGDPETVGRWLDANKMRAEFGKLYEGDDLIERLTSRDMRSGKMQLVVPPEEVANEVFGRAGLKLGDKNLTRDLVRLRSVLGKDSDVWNALREEAFLRLFRSTEGAYGGSTVQRSFSGAKLATALDNALERSGGLMRVLFKPEEIAQMQQLKRAALAVTTTAKGGQNFSNTASAAASIMQNTLGKLVSGIGGKAGVILANTPLLKATYNVGQSFKAASRAPLGGTAVPARPALPYAGVGGGTLSQLGLPYFNP